MFLKFFFVPGMIHWRIIQGWFLHCLTLCFSLSLNAFPVRVSLRLLFKVSLSAFLFATCYFYGEGCFTHHRLPLSTFSLGLHFILGLNFSKVLCFRLVLYNTFCTKISLAAFCASAGASPSPFPVVSDFAWVLDGIFCRISFCCFCVFFFDFGAFVLSYTVLL